MNKELFFTAKLKIIGINPFVSLPKHVLNSIFKQSNKSKGPIPVKGKVNDKPYKQTLLRYKGVWTLYINLSMLKNSPKRIGEMIKVSIQYDPEERIIPIHPKLQKALNANKAAKEVFDKLAPSIQKEIVRYIANLKSEDSIDRNVKRAIGFLLGKEGFVGRKKLM